MMHPALTLVFVFLGFILGYGVGYGSGVFRANKKWLKKRDTRVWRLEKKCADLERGWGSYWDELREAYKLLRSSRYANPGDNKTTEWESKKRLFLDRVWHRISKRESYIERMEAMRQAKTNGSPL